MKIALTVALCLPLLSSAQVLELTPNSPCGAPGVGLVRSFAAGAETWVAEKREGKPGQYVGRSGRWLMGCKMPPACPDRIVYQWAEQRDTKPALCTPSVTTIRAVPNIGDTRQVHAIGKGGAIVGRAVYECTAKGWNLDQAQTYCRAQPKSKP